MSNPMSGTTKYPSTAIPVTIRNIYKDIISIILLIAGTILITVSLSFWIGWAAGLTALGVIFFIASFVLGYDKK